MHIGVKQSCTTMLLRVRADRDKAAYANTEVGHNGTYEYVNGPVGV